MIDHLTISGLIAVKRIYLPTEKTKMGTFSKLVFFVVVACRWMSSIYIFKPLSTFLYVAPLINLSNIDNFSSKIFLGNAGSRTVNCFFYFKQWDQCSLQISEPGVDFLTNKHQMFLSFSASSASLLIKINFFHFFSKKRRKRRSCWLKKIGR